MRLTPVFLCFDVFNTVKASRDFQSHIFISAFITLVLLRRAEPRGHQTIACVGRGASVQLSLRVLLSAQLKRKSSTSESCPSYSLPSARTVPPFFASFIEPAATRSS